MDPVARHQFWELIRGLRADGTTILLTTHYLDEAAELADRVGVVSGGRLVEVAPPDELGADLRRVSTVSWVEAGDRRQVHTEAPSAVLRDLLAVHGEIPGLSVTRPGLEDVYLQLVGPPHVRRSTPMTAVLTSRPAPAVDRADRAVARRPGAAALLPRAAAGGVLLRLSGRDAGDLRVVLGGDERPGDIPFAQYFLAGIAATGIMLTSFQALGTSIANERERGQLERLQLLGTPPVAYFAGKAGQVLATAGVQLAVLLPVAHYGFDVPMPVDLGHWLTFLWVAALGALAGTVLGIAASALPGQCDVGDHGDHRAGDRPAVLLRRLLRLPGAAGLDAAGRGGLPAEVAHPGHALGVPARTGRGVRDRGGLGARPHRGGACRVGDHRHRDLHAHLPLAAGRGMSSSPSLVGPPSSSPSGDADGGPPLSERGWRITRVVLHARVRASSSAWRPSTR